MIECPNCHEKIDDDRMYCPFCGFPIRGKNPPTHISEKESGFNENESQPKIKDDEEEVDGTDQFLILLSVMFFGILPIILISLLGKPGMGKIALKYYAFIFLFRLIIGIIILIFVFRFLVFKG